MMAIKCLTMAQRLCQAFGQQGWKVSMRRHTAQWIQKQIYLFLRRKQMRTVTNGTCT
jgi:hypothetical protein